MADTLDLGDDLPVEVVVLAAEYGIEPFAPPVYRYALNLQGGQDLVCTLCGCPVVQPVAHTEWHHLQWTAWSVRPA